MNVSVLILTLNEERNISDCLESVKWSDDIVIFDSFSTDRTSEIAESFGARIFKRKFDNERNQRTAALALPFRNPWVYNPDADEITTPELRDEILETTCNTHRQEVAYRVRFKTMFMGQWIRHSSLYPTWIIRLFQPNKISFERRINLRYVVNGPEGKLAGHIIHHTFKKGLTDWFDKHNKYSLYEAEECLKSTSEKNFSLKNLLSANPVMRRRALKELSFKMPYRPLMRFLYMYVIRRGFLDGRPGFHYCCLLSIYEYMIVLKKKEMQRKDKSLLLRR